MCKVCVGLGGIVGNILGIFWFYKKVAQRNFHQLMLSLAVVDTVYILGNFFIFSVPSIHGRIWESYIYTKLFTMMLPVCQVALTSSTYLTLAVAVERYTTVCHPFFKVSHQFQASKFYILPILVFSIIYNVPKFFELKVGVVENEDIWPKSTNLSSFNNTIIEFADPSTTLYSLEPSTLRLSSSYIKAYLIILNLITHCVLPITLLVLLNLAVYKEVRKMSEQLDHDNSFRGPLHKREIKLAKVSVAIVAVFVICHGIRWIPNIWEFAHIGSAEAYSWPKWVEYMTNLSHLTTTLNSSVNFYIYMMKHRNRNSNTTSRAQITFYSNVKLIHDEEVVESIALSPIIVPGTNFESKNVSAV